MGPFINKSFRPAVTALWDQCTVHLKHPPASLSLTCGTAALCTRVKPRLLSASLPCGPHCQALLFLSRTAHPLSAVGFLIDGWYRFAPSDHLVSRPSPLDQRPTAPDSIPRAFSNSAEAIQGEPLDSSSTVHVDSSRGRARIYSRGRGPSDSGSTAHKPPRRLKVLGSRIA